MLFSFSATYTKALLHSFLAVDTCLSCMPMVTQRGCVYSINMNGSSSSSRAARQTTSTVRSPSSLVAGFSCLLWVPTPSVRDLFFPPCARYPFVFLFHAVCLSACLYVCLVMLCVSTVPVQSDFSFPSTVELECCSVSATVKVSRCVLHILVSTDGLGNGSITQSLGSF